MGESLTIELPSTRDGIATATEQAERWLYLHRASPHALNLVLLAIEELVINCIHYGYDDDKVHTIAIDLSIEDETLTVTFIDDGHPFDPLRAPAPDLSLKAQDRPVGGLGIHLLRQLSDHVSYRRHDGTNRFTLTKRLR